MGRILFSVLGILFSVQGIAVLYAFSPIGPAREGTKLELWANLTLGGFPAAFLCVSIVLASWRKSVAPGLVDYTELGVVAVMLFLGLWLTMIYPWNIVIRGAGAVIAVALGIANLLLR